MTSAPSPNAESRPNDPAWAEIIGIGFYVPEETLNVSIYVVARPALGVAFASVCMNSGDALVPWRADYCDARSYLALTQPFDVNDLRFENGLCIRSGYDGVVSHIAYDDGEGTTIDVAFDALMAPFLVFDQTCNPLAPADIPMFAGAEQAHYEQTGHFRGELTVRGRRLPVDCVSTLDRGSGPRRERGQVQPGANMSWLHAHFGDDFAIHATMSFDQRRGGTDLALRYGYVLDRGAVHGLRQGIGRVARDDDLYVETIEVDLTDVSDARYRLTGRALTRFHWPVSHNVFACTALLGWQHHEPDRVGYGEVQDFFETPALQAGAASHLSIGDLS